MSQKEYIRGLLLKFSRNRCSRKEIEELLRYFRKNPEVQVLPEVQEVLENQDYGSSTYPEKRDRLYRKLEKKIENDKLQQLDAGHKKRKIWYAAVAAVFVVILGGSLYFGLMKNELQLNKTPIAVENEIILEREDGKMEVISENGQLQLTNKKGELVGGQKGNQLVYQKRKNTSEEIVFNTLRIPYGKRFEIQLSDGSRVFMNSGSSLKYPVNFPKNDKRQVFLTGEAFFKVAKDNERPFVVEAQNLKVGVLGTEFNVSAYPEDTTTNVVLVEGSVALGIKEGQEETTILKPGQLGAANRSNNNLKISEVETDIYTSWMQGALVFRNISFENILKKMERHYNVKIINKDIALAREKFNASFGKEPLDNILKYFKEIYGLNYTHKSKNVIIINPKNEKNDEMKLQ
ncbi:FecR family protein [Salegentibacter echinorum]|uniref:FecR family protein n=1 Tax=Salegentibacter echinorum TaxID=1073325 RepID=A0A1M5IDT4_SALEC|nr:FecR domain-containing protein [Salegentibacter echinorum]SHG26397.1 FecR family protein [Salegentibacter echinorum]